MIDIEGYIAQLTSLLRQKFGEKLLYIGLQGSYLRGEATQDSDIDIMVILDELTVADLTAYRGIIASMAHFDKSCGFICGKEDLVNWNPMEIGHLLHTTKDYYGVLRDFVPAYTQQDVRNFVKMSLNNLYHEICHRYVHGDANQNTQALPLSYKSVFFILQNLHYLRSGDFAATKAELLQCLQGRDRTVLEHAIVLNETADYDFAESYALLFAWCQDTLRSV